ncbi:glycoside hydrolase superfamily [Tricladium varicosporioides]|nr:glycoside hydrolase superfamily [Hymenoscyphus varicosporioides]
MKLFNFASVLSLLSWEVLSQQQWPLHDNGLNKVVQWDHYSHIINGQRLFIWSGEMHYWRIPVPELWRDILEKVKAAGFNTVSFYANWGYHSPKEGTVDFESSTRNFERLFDIAKEIGLYILFRPGPYVNAEASAGGFPGWLTTGAYGTLRNNDTRYTKAWTPYMTAITKIIAKHQVTNGGNVFIFQIENEYGNQWKSIATKTPNYPAIDYMELLEANARENGIDVPLIHNNPNMNSKSWSKDFSNEGGNVDIYAADHYPSCWSCDLSECTGTNGAVPEFTTYDIYYTSFQSVAPTQPSFLAEFQGGSYNPWGGPEGGCVNTTGPDWVNVFYRHNIAQKISAMNIYMIFGGTNWGGLPMPMIATSYDYSAPISEARTLGDKYHETKLFGMFIRAARDLTKVDRINNNTAYASTTAIFTTELRNPDTNGAFYVTAHTLSPSKDLTPFRLNVSTSEGAFSIPQYAKDIVLNGRESKIIITDFGVGSQKIVYSTAEVLAVSVQDGLPLVVLWLPAGQSGEFFLTGVKRGSVSKGDGCSDIDFKQVEGGIIAFYTQLNGSAVIEFDNHFRFMLVDRSTAYYTWMPSLSADPYTPENSTIIVQGPYLIRKASISGKMLAITGDWSMATEVEIFAPTSVERVSFNGASLSVRRTSHGSLVGRLAAPGHSVASIQAKLPALNKWRVNDGLPERRVSYDDSRWTIANHNSTQNPTKPATYPVLYTDEYGYHTGNLLFRGRFEGSGATGVHLALIGGVNSGWSAYLNGIHLGSYTGSSTLTNTSLDLSFSNATVNSNSTNILFIIQDNMGHDQTSGATNPRGIYNATLIGGGKFTSWKITGNAGGEENIDPIRGAYNEGGLHAERLGWHLSNFDDSAWSSGSPETGLATDGANFYRTVVPLDLPRGMDIALGFVLSSPAGSKLRAQLYVNGYQFGKYIPHIGNQIVFPVFPGILNYHGDNTIGLSVWAQEGTGASVTVEWTVIGAVESAFDLGFDSTYLRPGWVDRSAYY